MGDIAAPRVILVDGASFRGNIDMGNFDVERAEATGMPATVGTVRSMPEPFAESEGEEAVERPVTRVRTAVPVRKVAPPRRPPVSTPREPTPAKKKAKPAARKPAAKKKKAPAPKVRSVGRAKATRKKRS
jgi:hypothetical protein